MFIRVATISVTNHNDKHDTNLRMFIVAFYRTRIICTEISISDNYTDVCPLHFGRRKEEGHCEMRHDKKELIHIDDDHLIDVTISRCVSSNLLRFMLCVTMI